MSPAGLLWEHPGVEESYLISQLRRWIKVRGTNPKKLSKDAGLNDTAVHDILSGKVRNPRIDTIRKIAGALKCSPGEFTKDARSTIGLAEASASYAADLTPDFRAFIAALAEQLGRAEDPELVRLFAILAALFEEWRDSGKPFEPRAYLAKAAKFLEIYYLPEQQVRPA